MVDDQHLGLRVEGGRICVAFAMPERRRPTDHLGFGWVGEIEDDNARIPLSHECPLPFRVDRDPTHREVPQVGIGEHGLSDGLGRVPPEVPVGDRSRTLRIGDVDDAHIADLGFMVEEGIRGRRHHQHAIRLDPHVKIMDADRARTRPVGTQPLGIGRIGDVPEHQAAECVLISSDHTGRGPRPQSSR